MDVFVGREAELAALGHGADPPGRPLVALVSGGPGIGKTSLLRRFARAAGDGATFLAVPGAQERPFAFMNLVLRSLPASPAHPVDATADPWFAGTDLLHALTGRDRRESLTLVLDDAHLADAASLVALTFALRRLSRGGIHLVASSSLSGRATLPSALRRTLAMDGLDLVLTGLPRRDVRRLAQTRGIPLTSADVDRLHRVSKGLPIHVALLLDACAQVGRRDSVPCLGSLEDLVEARIRHCGDGTGALLRALAVTGRTSLSTLAWVAEVDRPAEALAEATEAHLVDVSGPFPHQSVGVAHPVVEQVLRSLIDDAERLALHERAATAAQSELASLGHRRVLEPPGKVARDYAELGHREARQGMWSPAAHALLTAAELAGPAGDRWWWEGLEALTRSGDVGRAAALTAARETAETPLRHLVLGQLAFYTGRSGDAEGHLRAACEEARAAGDLPLLGRAAGQLAHIALVAGRAEQAAAWARVSTEIVPAPEWPGTASIGLHAMALAVSGRYREALTVVNSGGGPTAGGNADAEIRCTRGALRLFVGDLDAARRELASVLDVTTRQGPVLWAVTALALLTDVEYRSGRWNRSLRYGELATSLAEDSEQIWLQAWVHATAALVPARRGLWAEAETHVQAAREVACTAGGSAYAAAAAVTLAHAHGVPEDVVAAAQPLLALARRAGAHEYGVMAWQDMYVEALTDLDLLDEAETALASLESSSRRSSCRSGLAAAARARARLERRLGNSSRASETFARALDLAGSATPFPRALTALDAAEHELARRNTARARELLATAMAVFGALAAEPFVQRCRDLFASTGTLPPCSGDDLPHVLTSQELLIAGLVAKGRTNRQIATHLVLSEKTVEFHLSRIYSKAHVHSRLQLARLVLTAAPPVEV